MFAQGTPEQGVDSQDRWERIQREWQERKGQRTAPRTTPRTTTPRTTTRTTPQRTRTQPQGSHPASAAGSTGTEAPTLLQTLLIESSTVQEEANTQPRTRGEATAPRLTRRPTDTRTLPPAEFDNREFPAAPRRAPATPAAPAANRLEMSPELARLIQQTRPNLPDDMTAIPPPVRSPAELEKITEISPVLNRPVDDKQSPEKNPQTFVELGHLPYEPRVAPEFSLTFEPTNAYNNPIYFEDPQLERYGHTFHPVIQPAVSAARFTGQLVTLPYQMYLHPPTKRQYHLGWYNPGDYVPDRIFQFPWNAKAAAAEAALILGTSYVTP